MINVLFQSESHYHVNRDKIKDAIIKELLPKVGTDAEVSISIVGDRQMHELNLKYRQIDATTDVLSFPLNDPTEKNTAFVDSPDNVFRLGDIVVSYPQAVSEAGIDNVLVDDKIVQLVLHGLNHLLGIHHPE